MLLKFLLLAFLPLLCGALVTVGFGAFEWDRVYGLPEKNGSPTPKYTNRVRVIFDTSNTLASAIKATNGTLVLYSATKSAEHKKLLNKALQMLEDARKQFADARDKENGHPSIRADIAAIKTINDLQQAIEQKKAENEISALASKAGTEMIDLTTEHSQAVEYQLTAAVWNAISIVIEVMFVGTVAYLLTLVLTAVVLTWSCHRRAKIVEENLGNLREGKPLRAQIKGGGDSLTKIDHLVHQLAEKLSSKSA